MHGRSPAGNCRLLAIADAPEAAARGADFLNWDPSPTA